MLLTGAASEVEYSQTSNVWAHFPIRPSASDHHTSYPSNVPCVALDPWSPIHRNSQSPDSLLCGKSIIFTHHRKPTFKCRPSFIQTPRSWRLLRPPPSPNKTLLLEGWSRWWTCVPVFKLDRGCHKWCIPVKSFHPPWLSVHRYLGRQILKYQSTWAATGGVWGAESRLHFTWLWWLTRISQTEKAVLLLNDQNNQKFLSGFFFFCMPRSYNCTNQTFLNLHLGLKLTDSSLETPVVNVSPLHSSPPPTAAISDWREGRGRSHKLGLR